MANIDLTGADGSISWVSGLTSGSDAPATARVTIARGRVFKGQYPTTRPGSASQRVALTEWRGGGVLRVISTDDGTPPLPTTTTGVLKVTLKASQNYQFRVVLVGLDFGYNSITGEPQFQSYEFTVTSTSTSDTIQKDQ